MKIEKRSKVDKVWRIEVPRMYEKMTLDAG